MIRCQIPNLDNKNNSRLKLNINNSTWTQYIEENCFDSIFFKRPDYVEFYSCELGERHYGNYEIIGDTLIIKMLRGQFDNEFTKKSRHQLKSYTIKMMYSDSIMIDLNDQKVEYKRK